MKNRVRLLGAVRNVDKEALANLFDLYAPAIYKYAFSLGNNEWVADEFVGAVFARLLEHLSAGRGPASPLRPYIFGVVYHLFLDETQYSPRTAPIAPIDSPLSSEDFPTLDVTVGEQLIVEAVRRAIKNDLTEDEKHVIILRFLEGFSLKETARIMAKKIGNVKVIQNRAITKLRKVLDEVALGNIPVEVDVSAEIQT